MNLLLYISAIQPLNLTAKTDPVAIVTSFQSAALYPLCTYSQSTMLMDDDYLYTPQPRGRSITRNNTINLMIFQDEVGPTILMSKEV